VQKPIVLNAAQGLQAAKQGVVSYILLVLLVPVMVLFTVAYARFH
jgi:hypothetical protein